MIEKLLQYQKRPALFEPGTCSIWTDAHISMKMLEMHLDPNFDAASRKPETIDHTVDWISKNYLPEQGRLLDLGCGPGLYCERFSRKGHDVVGVDQRRLSITLTVS